MKFFNFIVAITFCFATPAFVSAQNAQPQTSTVKKTVKKKKSVKKVASAPANTNEFQAKGAPRAQAVAQKSEAKVSYARANFSKNVIDMGDIKEDAVVTKEFEFTNTGGTDLVILSAKGSCGCTSPQYPLTPIRPGDKGKISVTYTARNKVGPQKPEITVTTNGTPRTVKLRLEGWVEQIPGGIKE
ncbi:MAG: hypothetical protein RL757_3040 [Bacteroidota bacterium]|jgi:hypothetical protein